MLIRELSGHDYQRAQQALDWPMREVFVAYVGLLKQRAAEQYKFELLMWRIATAFGGNSKPPSPPEILRDPRTRRIRAGVKKPDS